MPVAEQSDDRGLLGGWRRNGRTAMYVKQGDLRGVRSVFMVSRRPKSRTRAGVRASIVVMKRPNRRGAKGCRKMDSQNTDKRKGYLRQ